MAIAVIVNKCAAHSPGTACSRDARLFAHVGERSVPIVVVQNIFAVVSDVHVLKAVVVVVAHAHTLAPSGRIESSLRSNVRECPVVIVVIEMTGRRGAGGWI